MIRIETSVQFSLLFLGKTQRIWNLSDTIPDALYQLDSVRDA
jgi:hypothetical protein